jgi:hypothetical protein
MKVTRFNEWLNEAEDAFTEDEIGRMGDLGLDDREPNDHLQEMMDDWFNNAEVQAAQQVLIDWMQRQLAKRVTDQNQEAWQDELAYQVQNAAVGNTGTFEQILFDVASSNGLQF